MTRFIFRRVVYAIPTVIGVTLLSFLMLKAVPGDPALLLAGEDQNPEVIEAIRRNLGLDRPIPIQYLNYVLGIFQLDFGVSYTTSEPVADLIARTFPRTIILAVSGILFASTFGLLLGTLAALRPNTAVDGAAHIISVIGMTLPSFWLGLMLMFFFSVELGWLPLLGLATPAHLILPMVTISAFSLGQIARMTRGSLIEVMQQDYIRAARAKGLSGRAVVLGHAFKNALTPVVAISGVSLGFMLAGAVIVEQVFSIDGIGHMMVQGIFNRDAPVVQGGVVVVALSFVFITIAIDIIQAYLDPKLRYE